VSPRDRDSDTEDEPAHRRRSAHVRGRKHRETEHHENEQHSSRGGSPHSRSSRSVGHGRAHDTPRRETTGPDKREAWQMHVGEIRGMMTGDTFTMRRDRDGVARPSPAPSGSSRRETHNDDDNATIYDVHEVRPVVGGSLDANYARFVSLIGMKNELTSNLRANEDMLPQVVPYIAEDDAQVLRATIAGQRSALQSIQTEMEVIRVTLINALQPRLSAYDLIRQRAQGLGRDERDHFDRKTRQVMEYMQQTRDSQH